VRVRAERRVGHVGRDEVVAVTRTDVTGSKS
jgi:hypothetical protein